MNKKKLMMTASAVAIIAFAWVVLTSPFGVARVDKKTRLKAGLRKSDITDLAFVGYNNWSYVMRNTGSYFYDSPDADRNGNNAGGEFPRGSGTTIVFAAGAYIGTLKNGVKVVSETEFSSEFQPGRITNSGVPFAELVADDPAAQDNQVYLIDRSLTGDDYSAWPSDAPKGPFGEPGLIADAQTWVVYNDLDIERNQEGDDVSPDPGLGMEIVLESFAFNAGPLSDVVYLKFTINNKTNVDYSSSYLGLWMDADVDNASNDIVGVDTARGLGFVYNADASDKAFATGFDFFQGPVVDTADVAASLSAKFATNKSILQYNTSLKRYEVVNLPTNQVWLGATSFNTYANGTDPADNIERYNLLAGLFVNGNAKNGTGVSDYYAFRGDPTAPGASTDPNVATAGDAADQRILHGVGPFTVFAGASLEVWAGVVGAAGTDRINAVANMFNTDDLAQKTFEAGLIAPAPPDVPKISVVALNGAVTVSWQNSSEFSEDIAGDILGINTGNGYTDDFVTYDFQGYRVWKSRTGLPGTFTMLAQYDKNDGVTTIVNRTLNTAAVLEIEEIRVGYDTGLRYSYVDNDVVNGQPYYYSVTAYDAQPYIAGPGSYNLNEAKWIVEATATGVILRDEVQLADGDNSTTIWEPDPIYLDSLAFATDTDHRSGGVAGIADDTLLVMIDTNTVLDDTAIVVQRRYTIESLEHQTETFDYNTLAAAFRQEGTDDPADIAIGDGFSFLTEFGFSDGHDESNIFRFEVDYVQTFTGSVPAPSGLPISLESSPTANVVLVVPSIPVIGQNYEASVGTVAHTGPSDGSITVEIVDPTLVKSATYTVSHFTIPSDCTGAPLVGDEFLPASLLAYQVTAGSTVLTLGSRADDPRTYYDVNGNDTFNLGIDVKLDDSRFGVNQALVANESTHEPVIADGMKITVFGPSDDVKSFQCVANGVGPLSPPDMAAFGFNASGFPLWNDLDRPAVRNLGATGGLWGFHTGYVGDDISFDFFKERTFRNDNFTRFVPWDFEMRFTAAGGSGRWAFQTGTPGGAVPFELWNIGINTPTDASDDYRMVPYVLDGDAAIGSGPGDLAYGFHGLDHPISGGDNDPQLDWVYWRDVTNKAPGSAGYTTWSANPSGTTGVGGEVMARTVLVNWNGGSVATATYNQSMPATGTIFRIVSTKPNTVNDSYAFTGTARQTTASKSDMKAALKNAKVVPNPYYGRSTYQSSLFDKRIKFTNLPGNCTIRIFTVAGDLVATLAHNASSNNDRRDTNPLSQTAVATGQETSTETWDVRNPDGKFVASGMYVAVIDAPGIGKKTLKFAVIQETITINGPDVR